MIGSVVAASAQLLNQATRFLWMTASESHELQSTARLLSTTLASRFLMRGALLIAGGAALPLFVSRTAADLRSRSPSHWPAKFSAAICSSLAWCRKIWPRPTSRRQQRAA